jgi:hypothetical protein
MYAILDTLIDESVAVLPKYPPHLAKGPATAFAKNTFNQIDCILLRKRQRITAPWLFSTLTGERRYGRAAP